MLGKIYFPTESLSSLLNIVIIVVRVSKGLDYISLFSSHLFFLLHLQVNEEFMRKLRKISVKHLIYFQFISYFFIYFPFISYLFLHPINIITILAFPGLSLFFAHFSLFSPLFLVFPSSFSADPNHPVFNTK